jgi:hypothetical protein
MKWLPPVFPQAAQGTGSVFEAACCFAFFFDLDFLGMTAVYRCNKVNTMDSVTSSINGGR